MATQIRGAIKIQRVSIYDALGALAVRGTEEQMAAAERWLEDQAPSRPGSR